MMQLLLLGFIAVWIVAAALARAKQHRELRAEVQANTKIGSKTLTEILREVREARAEMQTLTLVADRIVRNIQKKAPPPVRLTEAQNREIGIEQGLYFLMMAEDQFAQSNTEKKALKTVINNYKKKYEL